MEPQIRTLIDISGSQAALEGQADLVLERAQWASTVYQRFGRGQVQDIVDAVARRAHERAEHYAERAVEETGFGVVAHKKLKNEMTALPLVDYYRDHDYINPRVDTARKIVEIPRPAGVVFALLPSTNPVATLNYKVILALMTHNAIVLSPHPAARACCVDAARELSEAATAAGAPDGLVQVIERPTIPLVEVFMSSPKTRLILATGGNAMVRAAYSSSNPAIGVGPGNAPVLVDDSADINLAAKRIVESKSFDNSILCTNESVCITLPDADRRLRQAFSASRAHVCSPEEVERLRRLLFHPQGFNIECIGRDATWIAQEAGIRVPQNTLILVAPITQIGVEEPLSREKLCPVLSYLVARNLDQAIGQARAVLRLAGKGHSAAVHSMDESVTMAFASAVECYRVVVNAPCSQGAAGIGTGLPPTYTIGTGYFGRSTVGENIGPGHLVHWTRMAYRNDEPFGDYEGRGRAFEGALPEAPSDGVPGSPRAVTPASPGRPASAALPDREALRRMIAEELRDLLKK